MESPIQALRSGDIPGAVAALAAMPVMRLVAVRDRQPFVTRMFNHNAGLFRVDPTRLVPARPAATEQLERLTLRRERRMSMWRGWNGAVTWRRLTAPIRCSERSSSISARATEGRRGVDGYRSLENGNTAGCATAR
jgi:hypothetical protein